MSTRAEILAQITSLLPDNNTRAISPTDLRTVVNSLTTSCVNSADDGTPADAAAASTAAHNTDPAAHLNIVRRTLSANLVLTATDQPHQRIIPDADRNVTLPAETAGTQWQFLLCHAGASYTLTVKRAGGTTVGVVIPSGTATCEWDGTAFRTY